ncbi:MAG: hypothetical protein HRT89_10530 [Lentisphaeria bacterium]|nr:hypothetical protein [Lentisphaeria bacterium]NQZ68492.1 hypothetical protein [Lentisphaeria bacterium]
MNEENDSESDSNPELIFQKHGHILNRKRMPWTIAWQYDVMSDSIIWFDEWLLGLPVELTWTLRMVYHHRSAIICGEEENSEWKDIYDMGKLYFPKWRGYRKRRNQYCPKKSDRLKRIRKVSDWKIDKIINEVDKEN